jgi:DNA-binding PadR family transcriptional regulator
MLNLTVSQEVFLHAIREKPRYAQEISRLITQASGNSLILLPNSLYPTLRLMEDKGFTSSFERDGKRYYKITHAGLQVLQEKEKIIKAFESG